MHKIVTGYNVSRTTITRALQREGLKQKWALKKPRLTSQHKKNRLAWALAHKNWTLSDWRRVIWSDEASFCLSSSARNRVWQRANERFHPDCITGTVKFGGGKKLMVWGCISYNNEVDSLARFDPGSVNGAEYKKMLQKALIPVLPKNKKQWTFMQDGASVHNTNENKVFPRKNS